MNLKQATDLLEMVELYLGAGRARLYQIANGDWVVILKKHSYFLWNWADWRSYRGEPTTQQQPTMQAVASSLQEEVAV